MVKWANVFHRKKFEKSVSSPDKSICCNIVLKNNQLIYLVTKNNKPIINESRLGISICGEQPIANKIMLVRHQEKKHREDIAMPWGEDETINNDYNELAIFLSEDQPPYRIMTIRFRVFNNAVAFRYEIPPQPKFSQVSIKDEVTEFNIDPNSIAWKIPAYQPDRYEYNYEKVNLGSIAGSVHTPLTIRTPNGFYLSLHEAALYNYGSATIKLNNERHLITDITPLSDGTKAHVLLPFQTPWRLVMIAESAIELTTNRTMYALNDPPKMDFSWVKTLKFIGIWWAMYVGEWTWAKGERHGATTEHAKEYIDAAVRLGIGGVLIEGWNEGWEGDWLQNGVNNQFTQPTPDFDLEAVASYARKRGVEIVGHHETVGFIDNYEKQLESAYNYYAANGINYIKTGYAGSMMLINGRKEFHHSQLGVNHYQKTVELAAKKHICLDIHEPIKGTGIERTWPNLLSREGARGQEYEGGAIAPSHACILPYTRLLSGGMDYTSGIFDLENNVKRIATTLARQLAYFVVIYSGMQMAADRPFIYEERFKQEFEFIKNVPTNFSKSIPLAGEIGEYYVVARKDREKDNWYIGGITDENGRTLHLKYNFLEEGKAYSATIYSDADNAHYRDEPFAITIRNMKISHNDSIDIYLAPGGGFAIELKKVS